MIILTLLTKMIACSVILYGYYWMFLRNKRFHHYNRFYLLAATALSIVIPFIKIPVFLNPEPEPVQRKITEAELADIQQKQKALLEKHEEMESAQRRLSEARLTRIHNEQRDLMEKKHELELEKRK
jgi:membrane protein insertase Oxa1/YidC/SpoIIIJ